MAKKILNLKSSGVTVETTNTTPVWDATTYTTGNLLPGTDSTITNIYLDISTIMGTTYYNKINNIVFSCKAESNRTSQDRGALYLSYYNSSDSQVYSINGETIGHEDSPTSHSCSISASSCIVNNKVKLSLKFHNNMSILTIKFFLSQIALEVEYEQKCNITCSAGTGGTVTGGGTYDYGNSATLSAIPNTGYKFVKWSDNNTSNPRTITVSGNAAYTATFEKLKYTVNFKNQDGSIVKTNTNVEHGTTLGTLPTVSRSGYVFAGWIPCEPAKKTDGTVLDSYKYNGGNAYPLDTKYKNYTNNLSVHIEAYMSNWMDIKNRQIMSCTENGGWGFGYQANSKVDGAESHGFEVHTGSGYTGYDLKFGTNGIYTNNKWYSFDIVFSNGIIEIFVDGVSKGRRTASGSTIKYNSSNTIFVGGEAKGDTSSAQNYFKGFISNAFIANQGTRLAAATTSTVVESNIDYYPIWRLIPTYTITTSSENGTVTGGGSYEYGSTVTLTATPNTGYKFVKWSDGNTSATRTITVTDDITLTAEMSLIQYTLIYDDGSGNRINGIILKYNEEHKIKYFDDIFSASNYPTWNLIYDDNGATEYFIDGEVVKRTWNNRWRQDGTTTDYVPNSVVTGLSSLDGDTVILKARWKAEAIKTNLSIPTRKYHEFIGWADSSGNKYYQGDNFTFTANNSSLTAQWKKIQPRMFAGIDNIQKLFLSKDKEIKKIFVYITPENNGSGTHIEV